MFVEVVFEWLVVWDVVEGCEGVCVSDVGGMLMVVGVMLVWEMVWWVMIDVEVYREVMRAASSAAAVASTSGGLIGKLVFDGVSDVVLEMRVKGGGEWEGEG